MVSSVLSVRLSVFVVVPIVFSRWPTLAFLCYVSRWSCLSSLYFCMWFGGGVVGGGLFFIFAVLYTLDFFATYDSSSSGGASSN